MRRLTVCVALAITTALVAGCAQSKATVSTGAARSAIATDPVSFTSVSSALDEGGPTKVTRLFGAPTATYTAVYDLKTGESGGGAVELDGDKVYVVHWALDAQDDPVISDHYISASSDSTPTAQDREFVELLVDGQTYVEQANSKLAAFMPGKWTPLSPSLEGPRSKLSVWDLPSGGFVVDDFSGFSEADAKRLELDQVGAPFGLLVWDANHVEVN